MGRPADVKVPFADVFIDCNKLAAETVPCSVFISPLVETDAKTFMEEDNISPVNNKGFAWQPSWKLNLSSDQTVVSLSSLIKHI